MNDILYKGTIKGFPLIKFQNEEIINKTIGGSFYMNSLKHYRELYEMKGDEFIGDPCEGKIFISEKLNAQFIVPEKGIFQNLKDVAISTPSEDDFVFCMFGVDPNEYTEFKFSEEQREKIISTYDTALLITDVYEYFKRIKQKAVSEGIDIAEGFVKYYDECIDTPQLFLNLMSGMEKVVYYKRKKYSIQQEYRFTVPNPRKDMHFEFNIGDISDISVAMPSKDVCNAIITERKD